jgi:hypothetical protein
MLAAAKKSLAQMEEEDRRRHEAIQRVLQRREAGFWTDMRAQGILIAFLGLALLIAGLLVSEIAPIVAGILAFVLGVIWSIRFKKRQIEALRRMEESALISPSRYITYDEVRRKGV